MAYEVSVRHVPGDESHPPGVIIGLNMEAALWLYGFVGRFQSSRRRFRPDFYWALSAALGSDRLDDPSYRAGSEEYTRETGRPR